MARQQLKTGQLDNFWAGQYELSAKYLIGEPLAFFRSELIASALSVENFHETLPLYKDFLQKNPFPLYDEKIEGLYQKYSRVSAGAVAPAFSTVDNEGKSLELSQFQGKIVYLNFWASWCGACLRKMEFMNEFEYELKSNNIEIINVSIDENPNAWQSALQSQVFRGHHVLSTANNLNIAEMYGVEAIPQYFIIGKTGLFENKPAGNQPNDIRQQLLDIHQKGQ
jgi:thiol-disulfide isomerase/thioredoxin